MGSKIKVYLDTSVLSYMDQQDSPEKMLETREVWELLKQDRYEIYISDVVLDELGRCNETKLEILLNYLQQIEYHVIKTDENTVELAEKMIDFGV
ncbi:MAG: twitching motility protein PilT [Lachnospiraceae bacterium]|nr:twitching motility protein PilT [Lachnospiraceae bacterium]